MKTPKHCIVMRNPPGYRHPPLDLAPLGVKEEGIALATTIPYRNTIANIDIGFKVEQGISFPWEEMLHYITVLSMVKGAFYDMVREDVKKIIDHDSLDVYSTIIETEPLVEAIADIREEYDPEYRNVMKKYRKAVMDYFGTNDQSIFFRRSDLQQRVEKEKELLRKAADNLIRLYQGPKTEKILTPLLTLTIYTGSTYPNHREFLESCSESNKTWKSVFGLQDIFGIILGSTSKQPPYFPLDHFHLFVGQTIHLLHDVMEYYSLTYEKVGFLALALPSMMSAIDFSMGLFGYFNIVVSPVVSATGNIGLKSEIIPRLRKLYTEFLLMKQLLRHYSQRYDCLLCKSYNWVADPDNSSDSIINSIGGKTIRTYIASYYLNRYSILLDLIMAFEKIIAKKQSECPYCQEAIDNFWRIAPDLAEELSKGYLSKKYALISYLLHYAAVDLNSMLMEHLKQISYKYIIELDI